MPRPLFYYLKNKVPVAIDQQDRGAVLKWAGAMFESDTTPVVARTELQGILISTVFLGIDHQFLKGPPILFETMIFNHANNVYQRRYSTWAQAESGHMEAVEVVEQHLEQLQSLSTEQAATEIKRIMSKV